jgi:hypothetical protein
VRSKVGGKEPRKDLDIILARRTVSDFVVTVPTIEPRAEGWRNILGSEWGADNDHLFEEQKASCQMREKNGAIHMIAFFCLILNTDPLYVDPFFCWEEGFEMRPRTAVLMDDQNELLYYDFRTVFGVVIAYIAGYLMHYHIEITLAMQDDEVGCRFVNNGKLIFWDSDAREFHLTDGARDSNYNPDVMKYITPHNFHQARWSELEGIVGEVLAMWRGRNWASFAADVYRRTSARFNFFRRPWVRSLRMLWRGYKTDLCLGMARSAAQRKSIEKEDAHL